MVYSKKLPANAKPLFHSNQGWQYQHSEYQRLLSEHNIVQVCLEKETVWTTVRWKTSSED